MGRPQLFLVVEGTLAQIWGLGLVQRAQLLPGPLHGPGQLRHSRGTQAIHRYCSSRSAMFSRNFSRVFFFSQEIIWLNSEKVINLDLIIMAIKCQSNQDRSVVLIWDQPEKMSAFFFMFDTMLTVFCRQILKNSWPLPLFNCQRLLWTTTICRYR